MTGRQKRWNLRNINRKSPGYLRETEKTALWNGLSSRPVGGSLASELAEKYRKKYPGRPAMLEELEGI